MDQTRRELLLGGAAALAGAALAPAALREASAAAPLAGKQVPGWYRYKVGDFEITAITDGARATKLADNFIRNASKDEMGAGLASVYMDKENPVFPFTPVVVNTGSKLVVIDTGLGQGAYDQSKGALGQFATNMAASGIDPKNVDVVVISHFHGDHINGLLTADNKPVYPNAELMVPEVEWKYWMDEGNMSRAPEGLKGNFNNVRRVFGAFANKATQYTHGKDVLPGINAIATPGHTPGHTSYIVSSGSGRLLVQSDVTAGPAMLFVRNPAWQGAFDMDGGVAVDTRRKLYDQAVADKMLVQGFHFPFPSAGYLEKDGGGYRFAAVAWNPTI